MRACLEKTKVDLILLDLVLPGEDGLQLARDVRTRSNVGIIMVTGRADLVDTVVGLEVGADDYVAKPFHLREVLARIKSVLRRLQPASQAAPHTAPETDVGELIWFDGWCLDLGRRELKSPDGIAIPLDDRRVRPPRHFCKASGPRPRPRHPDGRDAGAAMGGLRSGHRCASRASATEDRARSKKSNSHQVGAWRRIRFHRKDPTKLSRLRPQDQTQGSLIFLKAAASRGWSNFPNPDAPSV